MQRAERGAGNAGKVLRARDGAVFLYELDEPIGERHLLGADGLEASQERFHACAYRLEVDVRRCAGRLARCGFGRHDAVYQLAHGNACERRETGRRELGAEDGAAVRELSDEALRRGAMDLETAHARREVDARVRQDLLRERWPPFAIPLHAPETGDEVGKVIGRSLAPKRKVLEALERVQDSDRALGAHRSIVYAWRTFAIRGRELELLSLAVNNMSQTKTYSGSCHCGKVRFVVTAEITGASTCNCSICGRVGALMLSVPPAAFKLEAGADAQADYQFGKKTMHHLFCSTCGVRSFGRYVAEGQEKVLVNLRCLEGLDVDALAVQKFDGKSYG